MSKTLRRNNEYGTITIEELIGELEEILGRRGNLPVRVATSLTNTMDILATLEPYPNGHPDDLLEEVNLMTPESAQDLENYDAGLPAGKADGLN